MSRGFAEYAAYYDLLYRKKDYAGEAAFVDALIGAHTKRKDAPLRLLDLACGTGRHSREFAGLGYEVEGADISPEMIDVARADTARAGLSIPFHVESFESCDNLKTKFDVVVAMFAAVNYLTSVNDFGTMLGNVRGLLNPGGLFIFDFWNGSAVEKQYSPERTLTAEGEGREVKRVSRTSIDTKNQTAVVCFNFSLTENSKPVRTFDEVHNLRYYFLDEMDELLKFESFDILARHPFLQPEVEAGADDWNVTYVARTRTVTNG